MKKTVLVAVLLASVQSQAQIKEGYQRIKQTVTGSAKISQPHYLTSQWEVLARAGLTFTNRDYKLSSSGGFDANEKKQAINTELTLGVLDNISVGVAWDYILNDKYTYDGGPSEQKYKGSADPVVNLTGRAGDFEYVKIDLKVAYQPKTADIKIADDTHDGNAVNGYRLTIVGAEFDFLVTATSQVFLVGEYSNLSEKTSIDQTTGDITNVKSLKSTNLKVGTLTEIISDSFFGVTYTMLKQDGGLTIQNDGTTTVESPEITASALTAVIKHEFTPNSALDVQLEHVLNGALKYRTSESKIEGYALSVSYLVRFQLLKSESQQSEGKTRLKAF